MTISKWTTILLLAGTLLAPADAQMWGSDDALNKAVAPYALYPDTLLAQVLAASTFPDQVIEATTWCGQHPGMQGEALAKAMDEKSWDQSVEALCTFPDVLQKMNKSLDQTRALGQAFVSDPAGVMDAVQNMRAQAQTMGALTDTPQQKVIVTDNAIQIQPAQQDTLYVPDYDDSYLYGGSTYPYGAGLLTFGTGVALGAAFNNNYGAFNWATHGMYTGAAVRANYYAGNYTYPGVNSWTRAGAYSAGGYRNYAPAASAIYRSPANAAGYNTAGYRGYAPQANAIYHSPANAAGGYRSGVSGYAPQANAIYHGPTGGYNAGMESRAASRGYSSMGGYSGGTHFGGGRRR